MAYLWGDSFDYYGGQTDFQLRYPSSVWLAFNQSNYSNATMGFISGTGTAFSSGQALGVPANGNGFGQTWVTGSNETTIFFSIRLKCLWTTTSGYFLQLNLQDGGAVQCSIRWNGDGSISLYSGNGATLIANIPGAYGLNSWVSFQGKVVISATAGSIELRENGALTDNYTYTNINTGAGSSNSYVNNFALTASTSQQSSLTFAVDDLFFCSGSGGAPNNWLGDLLAVKQTVAGQTQAQLAPTGAASNWQCVDEAIADGDTTYVSSSTVGAEDIYTMSAIPTTYTIVGVNYLANWRKSDAGPRIGALSVAANGSADTQVMSAALGVGYASSPVFMSVDPTSAPWSPATVSGARVGIKVVA